MPGPVVADVFLLVHLCLCFLCIQWGLVLSETSPIKVEVFDNGEYKNGVNIELNNTDCEIVNEVGLNIVVLAKVGTISEFSASRLPEIHNGQGKIVKTCGEIVAYIDTDDDYANSLHIVPFQRVFLFPTMGVGMNRTLKHVDSHFTSLFPYEKGRTMTLETLAEEPRVFKIHNFFSSEEADFLVDYAQKITDADLKLRRSSTGSTGYNINPVRTSENAFDSMSHVAISLKQRGFSMLGLPRYDEELADGLQILRYNQSTAYISHLDWIDGNSDHDYNSALDGTNRYATIFLYLTDVEEGGETIFPQARPPSVSGKEALTREEAIEETTRYLENKGISQLFPEESWQRKMVADCRNMFTVKPKKGDAILFYSQHADGTTDLMSLHGGCPVIEGTKWAANLWVWNGPRNGYMIRDEETGVMRRKRPEEREAEEAELSDNDAMVESQARSVSFSSQVNGASLYWEDQFWGKLDVGKSVDVNSYIGHKWNVRVGETHIQWIVGEENERQIFVLREADLKEAPSK